MVEVVTLLPPPSVISMLSAPLTSQARSTLSLTIRLLFGVAVKLVIVGATRIVTLTVAVVVPVALVAESV